MRSFLTTITPYWKREEMLRAWVSAIRGATVPGVTHIVYFVGEWLPKWWAEEAPDSIVALACPEEVGLSIGHYHNLGAAAACSEWIMKMDVDAIPHVAYFRALMEVLVKAKPRQWFNGGMFYMNQVYSNTILRPSNLPLTEQVYRAIMLQRRTYAASSFMNPAASNFICRRRDYLDVGGCDERFRGYGWEDYQQIYVLEHHQRGNDPLPGGLTLDNVTQRCRDEISRPKAAQLFALDPLLCLLHKWHPIGSDASYRTSEGMKRNRAVLFERLRSYRFPV